ncbi:hypothetical protein [Coxiella-like endosymbiont]|uniref:hypothetical protein n=1 Tax=Coxiella-like endosymbiont TaxID=1592897 RepID=UPI002729B80B|nr:hypothetical protein [Coxiella-like endosymbiont]
MPAKICKELLNQLKKIEFNYEVIADFACGTGVSTQEISSVFSFNSMYAIDFCNSLLDEAQKKLEILKLYLFWLILMIFYFLKIHCS